MNDAWYEEVEASASADLAQGELIPTCLIPTFSHYDPSSGKDKWVLIHYEMDLIVLTQACDLAQRHVLEPLVCSCPVLAEYKCGWEEGMRAQGQQPTTKAWNSWLGKLKNKEFPGLCFLGPYTGTVSTEERVADFRQLYTLPRTYLEAVARKRQRLRLRSDYRNHVSQRLANFFSRIALP